MPQGNGPPKVFLPESVFDALVPLSYSSSQKAFLSGTTPIYLFVEKDSNGAPRWFHGTDADGANHPRGEIPAWTAEIIQSGTWQQDGTVSYDGSAYHIRLECESGVHVAKARTT